MSLKICYDDEIHKISKLPLNILDLRNKVNAVFQDNLPTNYRLEYLDSDGDRIVISNNTAYRELIDQGLPSGSKPLKIYVAYFNANRQKDKANAKATNGKNQHTGPIHIQNKEEFAEDLPKPDRSQVQGRMEAPSDESLPSSAEDHEEKVHEIYESVEELKKEGGVELHPEIYDDPDSEKEMQRAEERKEYKGEKEQKKLRELMDKIREKDLSDEKKEKVVKKMIKYKERLGEKQKEKAEKPVKQRKEKESKAKNVVDVRNPLELVISQVLQGMMPEITRLVGEHHTNSNQGRGQVQQRVIHQRIICDGCHMRPIVGVRYKCTVCPNFDYCEDCEENMGHPHPFIKIKTPQQDYFAHGHFYDNIHRRYPIQNHTPNYAQRERLPSGHYEPAPRYETMWVPKATTPKNQEPVQQPAQPTQAAQNTGKEKPVVQKAAKPQKVQKTQQKEKQQEKTQTQKPRVDSWEKVQKVEREKENYPSQAGKKTDRSDEVEIEDETHLIRDAERYNVIKEGRELRERQNQNWVPEKDDDLKGLEKERKAKETTKEHLGDVKAKASKLKKEFPSAKFDTLLRYVEEAPEDLTTEELVNNFLSWK